ncbi:MAG: hypothetical protein M0R39_08475 [Prolixibacteraceae bacterium]|jgi:hypothetical protein|nr:hypothetical protein [Prolixibacteraceae bacterium]
MELNIDLIPKRKRSNFTLAMGAITIILSIIYFTLRLHGDKEKSNPFLPMTLYMLLYGILGILNGLGYSVEKIFGCAYVHIDDEHIAIKTGVWTKVRSLSWCQIKSLEYKTNWYKIIDLNGIPSKLELSDLEFKNLVETRDAINFIASEKGIPIN